MKNNKYKKLLTIIIIFLLPLSLLGLGISIYNIFIWKIDNSKSSSETNKINDLVNIYEVSNDNNTEIIDTDVNNYTDQYHRFITMKFIDVDLSELKNINSNTIGWIEVPGTNINYPVVQTTDNDYYLTHSFYNENNQAGWIYMDYRNDPTGNNQNTIIYGHGRKNGTMFGSLKNTITDNWFYNDNYGIVRLSTETENSIWQIFSTYTIPTTNDYIQTSFASNEEYINFLNMLKGRSKYDFNVLLNEQDQIITLSSCYNNEDKIVVHAKLIKRTLNLN